VQVKRHTPLCKPMRAWNEQGLSTKQSTLQSDRWPISEIDIPPWCNEGGERLDVCQQQTGGVQWNVILLCHSRTLFGLEADHPFRPSTAPLGGPDWVMLQSLFYKLTPLSKAILFSQCRKSFSIIPSRFLFICLQDTGNLTRLAFSV
jgi:hypothetical protein